MKTKVWIVIWGLKDGGAETLAQSYARLVNQQEFEPTIVTMYPFTNTANYQRVMNAGIRVCSVFKRRNVVARIVRILMGRWYVPMILKRMLVKQRPDTIHFNSPMAYYFAPLKNQLSNVNLLYTCHSEVSQHFCEKKEETAVHQLIQNNALQLIALHEDMRVALNQRFHCDNTVVIKNGIDIQRFCAGQKDRDQTLDELGIDRDAYVVGHIGRFSKVKNHAFLLQVFREIMARKSNAHLLLVGNGELQDDITQAINQRHMEDCVTILSHRTDIPDLLHAMDVMVFPSLYEGLSVTLVEAQASGLKCVISDTINDANYLSEKTIPVGLDESVETWADIVLNDEIRNAEYGQIELYDMNREIHRLECLYQSQLGE